MGSPRSGTGLICMTYTLDCFAHVVNLLLKTPPRNSPPVSLLGLSLIGCSALGTRAHCTEATPLADGDAIASSALRLWGEMRAMEGHPYRGTRRGARSAVGPPESAGSGRENGEGGTFPRRGETRVPLCHRHTPRPVRGPKPREAAIQTQDFGIISDGGSCVNQNSDSRGAGSCRGDCPPRLTQQSRSWPCLFPGPVAITSRIRFCPLAMASTAALMAVHW
jgi:hypothetical protein